MDNQQLQVHLAQPQLTVGYHWQDISLLWEAFQAAGSPVVNLDGRPIIEGNKRLALIGDHVSKLVFSIDCYEASMRISQQTERVQAMLSNTNLAAAGRNFNLEFYIHLNPSQTRASGGMVATAVEAIMGAAFQDGGIEAVRTVMSSLGLVLQKLTTYPLTDSQLIMSAPACPFEADLPCPFACALPSRGHASLSRLGRLRLGETYLDRSAEPLQCHFHNGCGSTIATLLCADERALRVGFEGALLCAHDWSSSEGKPWGTSHHARQGNDVSDCSKGANHASYWVAFGPKTCKAELEDLEGRIMDRLGPTLVTPLKPGMTRAFGLRDAAQ